MRYSIVLAALCSIAAAVPSPVAAPEPVAQGVTQKVAPTDTPSQCLSTYESGDYFQIGLIAPGDSANEKRQVGPGVNPFLLPGNILLLKLQSGVIKDAIGRTGYIASNGQLQFDDPPQSGALYTAGFSACLNATLALETTTFYSCGSGGFSNLYSIYQGAQCSPINLGIYLYQGDVSSAIAGISAASTTGQLPPLASAMGLATRPQDLMTTTTLVGGMATADSDSSSTTGAARAAVTSVAITTSSSSSPMAAQTTAAGAMATSTDGNAAVANGVAMSVVGFAAMIGFSAFVL